MLKNEYILYFLFTLIGLSTHATAYCTHEGNDTKSTFVLEEHFDMRVATLDYINSVIPPPDLQAQTIKPHTPIAMDVASVNRNENGNNMITLLLNPSTKKIHVSSENKDIRTIELELLNALGQQVVKSKMNMNGSPAVLDTQNLPDGNYQVRIRCRNFLIYKKVIITK